MPENPSVRLTSKTGLAPSVDAEPGRETVGESVGGLEGRHSSVTSPRPCLQFKRVAMVTYSSYPADPRPRRAVDVMLKEGMTVDLICLRDAKEPKREAAGTVDVLRVPITHRRGGKLSYIYNYFAFLMISAGVLALRSLKKPYHLVYVHNMPDVLVLTALVPKLLGAKVILDMHDPMPELMTTIYNLENASLSVRLIRWLETWSMARATAVITVNLACKRIFSSRSCHPAKISVVMNSPDGDIFPFRTPHAPPSAPDDTQKRRVIMYHGSLVERNGLDLAIAALDQVKDTIPDVELRIYGRRTDFLDRVMETVREIGLHDRVHYLGPKRLEELVGAIEECDVGIIPNQRNAFTEINTPTRMFEYLALGKPVIAPRTPGIQDYFHPGSLFFFEPGDKDDLAQSIEYVLSHTGEAMENAKQGQKVYLAHAWSQERQILVNLIDSLLRENRAN